MNSLTEIQEFLAPKKMAFAGASRNPKKFGGVVFNELIKKGFELYPVHPAASEIGGVACVKSVKDLPEGVDLLYIVTPKKETLSVVRDAAEKGIRKIWIQQASDTQEALDLAKQHNMTVISGRCMMMFAEPVGSIHNVHRWFSRVFGTYPS
ncbi:MAG: CoA-binding protein [Bacteroidota bacterium]